MKEQQGSSSVYRSCTLPFSQAGMLAIAGMSLISGLWIQLEALPLVTGTSQVSWDSLAWIQKWNVRLEPSEVLQIFEGSPSKNRLNSKHVLESHLNQRRVKAGRARDLFADGTRKKSLVAKGDLAAKNFQNEVVLGKVRHDDEIHLNKAARGFADLESPGAGKDLTEQRKLMLMHRFLSLRMIVAVNALSIPASPEKDLVIAHQAREEEMRQNLIHDNSQLIHDKNRVKAQNNPPLENPAYQPAAVNRKIATISPTSVPLPKNGESNPYESKNEPNAFDLSSTEQQLGKMIFDATQSNLNRLKGELKGEMKELSLEDQVMHFSQSMDRESLLADSPEWWTTQRELANLTFDATRGVVQSLGGKDASVDFPETSERKQMVAWNGYSSVPGVEQPLTIRAAGRVSIPSANSLVSSQPGGQVLSSDHRAKSHLLESSRGPEKQSQPTQNTGMSESESPANPEDGMPTFVEAFDSQRRRVEGVSARMLSSEVAGGQFERGVGFAEESAHHWATLDWYDPASNGPQAVPLVSINSLHYIAMAGGVSSQSEKRGFLFGKIARGWEIHSADGGAQPVYLYARDIKDSAGNAIHAEGTVIRDDELVSERNEERYYVLLNVSPGAQWVQVSSVWGEGQAGVPVPIFHGTGTHRDLTQIAKRTFSGHVFLDGEEEDNPNSFPKYTIEVSGQPGFTAHFDFASTDFKIPNVITFGNYPFYIQVKSSDRPQEIHQYKVLPSEMHDFTVYQISQFKVDQWVAQFQDERVMDEAAGMKNLVIVAVPQLVKSNAPQELLPELSSLSSLEGKALKTFTIYPWKQVDSPYDEVKAGVSLSYQQNKKTRFIGSVPEGLALPAIRDSNGNVLWSELTMTWPLNSSDPAGAHIVNIIGPY